MGNVPCIELWYNSVMRCAGATVSESNSATKITGGGPPLYQQQPYSPETEPAALDASNAHDHLSLADYDSSSSLSSNHAAGAAAAAPLHSGHSMGGHSSSATARHMHLMHQPSLSGSSMNHQRDTNTLTTATSVSSQQSAKQSIIANANHMIFDSMQSQPSGPDRFTLPQLESTPPTSSAAPQQMGLPQYLSPPPASALQRGAAYHMHQDSVAHDISSALHSIPHPARHNRQDSRSTVIVHASASAHASGDTTTPVSRTGLHSVRMSTVGESSHPAAVSSQHRLHSAENVNPPSTLAANAYASVAGTGLAGAQYASPPASIDSTAPGMSLASGGGGPSMQEITQPMAHSALNTTQVSTVPSTVTSTVPPSTSAQSSMFGSETLPNQPPPSTRTESALNSVSYSPANSAQFTGPSQGFLGSPRATISSAPAQQPLAPGIGAGHSYKEVFVPPGAAENSSEVPEESSHLENPAAAPPPVMHDALSAPAVSKEGFSRSNFLQPVELPPPPEEPEFEDPSRHPPNVLCVAHHLNTQASTARLGRTSTAAHDTAQLVGGSNSGIPGAPSSRLHSIHSQHAQHANTRIHTQSSAVSSVIHSSGGLAGGGYPTPLAAGGRGQANANAAHDLDAMFTRESSNASELAEQDFPVPGELRWTGGAAMPVYNGPSVDDALGRRRSGSSRLQSQNVGAHMLP